MKSGDFLDWLIDEDSSIFEDTAFVPFVPVDTFFDSYLDQLADSMLVDSANESSSDQYSSTYNQPHYSSTYSQPAPHSVVPATHLVTTGLPPSEVSLQVGRGGGPIVFRFASGGLLVGTVGTFLSDTGFHPQEKGRSRPISGG
jgi:hypothetical protein